MLCNVEVPPLKKLVTEQALVVAMRQTLESLRSALKKRSRSSVAAPSPAPMPTLRTSSVKPIEVDDKSEAIAAIPLRTEDELITLLKIVQRSNSRDQGGAHYLIEDSLKLIHDFAMLNEVLSFHELRWEMESDTYAAKARAKAAEEKAINAVDKASQARLKLQQVLDNIGVLEGKVALEMATTDIQRERVIKLEKALVASKAVEKEAEERIEVVKARALVKKLMAIYEAKLRAMKG
ncbi:hypothetical protein COCNU_04G008230 [Cocos nucifera]|uniref:Uncharacterized protein n=1 Tax=Cocos nucifera TaxID=13894 RepID=A0A8K0I6D4_COCNU|nr:hypothetical protein COCNU_04G008230 [Cocos nucifera]